MISEPSRPEGPLIISNIEASSVHLSWKPPLEDNGGPILGYVIEAKDVLHMDVRKTYVWSEGSKTECVVQDLETSHIYQFRVYAQNEAGRGEGLLNKSLVRIKAKSKKPPKPSKPTAEIFGDESVFLQWSVAEDSENLNYIIERFEPKNELWFQCNREIVPTTSYLVSDLNTTREYIFRISSENVHGGSLPSEASDPVKWVVTEGEAPFVTVPLKDCFIRPSETAIFTCEFIGSHPIQVNWTKDDIRVRDGFGSVIKTDDGGKSELQLEEVDSEDDDCIVQCSLQNRFGKTSSEAAIHLQTVPKLGYPSSYKEGLTFDCGDTLKVRMTISGKPTPSIKWFFNDTEPFLDNRVSVIQLAESFEILVNELTAKDSGHYKVIASNEMGTDSIDIEVTIAGPPDSPDGHLVFKMTVDNEVVLNWNPPLRDGGSEVYSYIVEKKMTDDEEWSKFGTTHKTTLVLGHPDDIDGCTFRIRAKNIYGTGEASEELQFNQVHSSMKLDGTSSESTQSSNDTQREETGTDLISNLENESKFSQKRDENVDPKIAINPNKIDSQCVSSDYDISTYSSENYNNFDEMFTNVSKSEHSSIRTLMPLLYFCNSFPESYCEVSNFANITSSESHYIVSEFEYNNLYVIGSFTTCLESVNTLPENHYFSIDLFPEWIFYENFLEVYEPVCFVSFPDKYLEIDCITECISPNIWDKDAFCIIKDNHDINFDLFSSFKTYFEVVCEPNSAVIVILPPQLLENSIFCDIHIPQKEHCRTSFNCCKSISISLNCSLENVQYQDFSEKFLKSPEMIKYRSLSEEDFEGLVSICSTAVRTWKPAMSVLPIKRQVQSADLSQESHATAEISNLYNQETYQDDSFDMNVNETSIKSFFNRGDKQEYNNPLKPDELFSNTITSISDVIPQKVDLPAKSNELILNYLESTFKTDQDIDQWANIDEIIVNQDSISENACEKKSLNTLIEETRACSSPNILKIPDWLSQVSPCDISYKENVQANLKESKEEVILEGNKHNFKEKSVEELLQMAEEVERSFSDKAERIESLESILQGELFSLEKDLEAVNEIHRHLDDPYAFVDSYTYDEFGDDLLLSISNPVEENLIEFTEDVPYVSQEQLKTDEYPPEVIVHLQNRVVQSGCRTRLYCSIMGDPDPEIVWTKNRKPIPESTRYIFGNLVEFGVYMDIFNTKSTDSGEYACMATNRHGSAQTQGYVQVIGDREVSPEEPKFLKSPDDFSCPPGESVVMEWKITGTPMPHVMWFKNAAKIETNLRVDTFSNHRGCCRLVLHDVNADDSAIYSCYLENEAGSAVSTVLVSVTDIKTDYKIPIICESQLLTNKELIPVEEQFYSLPSDETMPLEETHYETKKKRKTSFGEKYFRTYKVHGDPPSSPLAVRVLNSGQTWTILTWSPPLEARSRFEYLIERRSLNSEHWIEVGRTYNTLYTVHGLKRGRSYVFRVSAGNSSGWSFPTTLSQPVHTLPK
ncbi:titin homolog [Caerostris darwini]|uniref:Titin homolog n=1 Tax=Caerostris darwini TaxID=1538125 RepID=A0AAV4QPL3_9ARAC|nr:titin homolog [Caerostris darwini]